MHELAIAQKIIEVIEAEAKKNGIKKVRLARLKIGRMAAFQRDQLEFCLTSYEKNETLSGMKFEIEEVPVRIKCENCGHSFEDARFDDAEFAHDIAHAPMLYARPACPKCGLEKNILVAGSEMELISIEGD